MQYFIQMKHASEVNYAKEDDETSFVLSKKKNYKKNNIISTDKREGNKRSRATRGSRFPKHGEKKHYIVHSLNLAHKTKENPRQH
jgi:hypothetical protein